MILPSKSIRVQVRTPTGPKNYILALPSDCTRLSGALAAVAETEWGNPAFEIECDHPRLKPGNVLVLNNRMIQPWEIDETPIGGGEDLKLIPVVAGG